MPATVPTESHHCITGPRQDDETRKESTGLEENKQALSADGIELMQKIQKNLLVNYWINKEN